MTFTPEEDQGFVDELFALDGQPGPAPRMGAASASALIDGALDAWEAAPAPDPEPANPTAPGAPVGGLGALGVGIAVFLVAVGVTSAVLYMVPEQGDEHVAAVPAPTRSPAPESAVPESPAPPANVVTPAPAEADTFPEASASAHRRPRERARRASAPATAPDLLARANEQRRARDYGAAERSYVQVVARFGNSSSAYVARVAAASLRLEHLGNARGAATLYREALRRRPNGNLDAEARYGLARAQRRLGQVNAERRTLEELLRQHPQAPFASRARSRLAELGAQ